MTRTLIILITLLGWLLAHGATNYVRASANGEQSGPILNVGTLFLR